MPTLLAKTLGLTDRELDLYKTGLKQGPQTASNLARQSNMSRTLAYHALDGLLKKGFTYSSGESYGAQFGMIPPRQLKDIVRQKKRELDDVIKSLDKLPKPKSSIDGSDTTVVHHYPGVTGIRTAAVELSKSSSRTLSSIVSMRHLADTIDLPFLRSWVQSLKRVGKQSRSLWTNEQTDPTYDTGLRKMRLLPSDMKFPGGVVIEEDKVMFFTAGKSPSATTITDAAIADMMQSIHDQLWKISSEPKRHRQARHS